MTPRMGGKEFNEQGCTRRSATPHARMRPTVAVDSARRGCRLASSTATRAFPAHGILPNRRARGRLGHDSVQKALISYTGLTSGSQCIRLPDPK